MDRKLCVLAYSSHSQACKELIDLIRSLPYDLPRLTGMTFLNVDCDAIRNKLTAEGITGVPTLLVMYFDGTRQKFQKESIYAWIQAINSVVQYQQPFREEEDDEKDGNLSSQQHSNEIRSNQERRNDTKNYRRKKKYPPMPPLEEKYNETSDDEPYDGDDNEVRVLPTITQVVTDKKSVMATAMEMQKMRENESSEKPGSIDTRDRKLKRGKTFL